MKATKDSIEPQSRDRLPNSTKVFRSGRIHPAIRVPFREIRLSAPKSHHSNGNGNGHPPEPVQVYDCSGPWGDESFHGNVEHGLPPLRRSWILARGDVVELPASNQAKGNGRFAPRAPLRAKPRKIVSQSEYARRGIITPEMEFIAIRENLGRDRAHPASNRTTGLRNLGGESF